MARPRVRMLRVMALQMNPAGRAGWKVMPPRGGGAGAGLAQTKALERDQSRERDQIQDQDRVQVQVQDRASRPEYLEHLGNALLCCPWCQFRRRHGDDSKGDCGDCPLARHTALGPVIAVPHGTFSGFGARFHQRSGRNFDRPLSSGLAWPSAGAGELGTSSKTLRQRAANPGFGHLVVRRSLDSNAKFASAPPAHEPACLRAGAAG